MTAEPQFFFLQSESIVLLKKLEKVLQIFLPVARYIFNDFFDVLLCAVSKVLF